MKNLMTEIYKLKEVKEKLEADSASIAEELKTVNSQIDLLLKDLLDSFKKSDVNKLEFDNLVAEKFTKESIAYTSDADVVNYLKEKYAGKHIKTKITENLDKNSLKKAIKTDTELAEALEAMLVKTSTEYVVVTTAENHAKMLEHINEQSS